MVTPGAFGTGTETSEFLIFRIQVSHKSIGRYKGHCRYQGWWTVAAAAASGVPAVSAAFPARSAPRGSTGLGTAEGGPGERKKSMRRKEERGEDATARATAPPPPRPPRWHATRPLRYGPAHGLGKGPGLSERPAGAEVPERRPRGPPPSAPG